MTSNESAVLDRAWVEFHDPATSTVENPVWIAKDPDSKCLAFGAVRAEAEGNLVAAVTEYERSDDTPLMKRSGRTVPRPPSSEDNPASLLDRFRSLF
ncbi:MAG: hypothetical protein ACOCQY_03330 [Halorhabdus sp.]